VKNFKSSALLSGVILLSAITMQARWQVPVGETTAPSFTSLQSTEISGLRLVKFSGVLKDQLGRPVTGVVGITFAIFKNQEGEGPLWLETQNVQLDTQGNYSALLGYTTGGIPLEIFSSDEPRWIGVRAQIPESAEQPRQLVISVPYALRAADADTLGGKAASEFVLRDSPGEKTSSSALSPDTRGLQPVPKDIGTVAVVNPGTVNHLAKYVTSADVGDSSVIEDASGNLGIGTVTPSAPLTVSGAGTGNYRQAYYLGTTNVGAGFSLQASGANPWSVLSTGAGAGQGPNKLLFYYDATQLSGMVLDSSGNVGIGTTTPSAPLTVRGAGTGNYRQAYYIGATNVGAGFSLQASGANPWSVLSTGAGSGQGPNKLLFYYDATQLSGMVLDSSGNVGIGTVNPATRLHVAGDVMVSGNIAAKYQDVAEWVETSEPLAPGTVVVVDVDHLGHVRSSGIAYDTTVVGAVSAQPGMILGEAGSNKVMVAQSGRVRIKVDAQYGSIRPGDLLVTSPTPGHAMRSEGVLLGNVTIHRPGTLLGKALEPLDEGTGEILALLTLQ